MRILPIVVILWSAVSLTVQAESDVQCPYEATVDADDLYVRSGPGTKYYPTGKLQSGQRVTVRRLDPGGWLMIDPPEGAFSLIPAEVVERTGANSGQVLENQVKIVMGSEQGQGRAVTQCELNQGDTVEILGEKILSLGGPAESWYQIRPPQGEYRWVHGKYLVPVDGIETAKQVREDRKKADALRTGTQTEFEPQANPAAPADKQSRIDKSGAISKSGPDLDTLVVEREQLKALDHEWELMLDRSPSQWKLDDMEQAYRDLLARLSVPVLKRQVDYRLRSLEAHRQVYADFIEFEKITDATDRRDQELQEEFAPPVVRQVGHETDPANSDIPPGAFPEATTADGIPPRESDELAPEQAPATGNPNKFVLTGRLVRTTPAGSRGQPGTTPQFALVGPNNQVLAFLHSTPQVGDLTPFINREVGINGSNWSRPGQPTNVYSVTQIAPLDGQAVRDSSTPQFAMPNQQQLPGQPIGTQQALGTHPLQQQSWGGQPAPGQPITGQTIPGQPIPGQPLMSQGSWQRPQQFGSMMNGNASIGGTMNQPIPSQYQGNISGAIRPTGGEQPAFTEGFSQQQNPHGAVQGIPLQDANASFSAYPPNNGMPQNGSQFQNNFQVPSPDQFQGGLIQNQSPYNQSMQNQMQQHPEGLDHGAYDQGAYSQGMPSDQQFSQPGSGQWQPATQMQQQQSGQAVQRGNVIYRPPQYSNQKKSWWPFGRRN